MFVTEHSTNVLPAFSSMTPSSVATAPGIIVLALPNTERGGAGRKEPCNASSKSPSSANGPMDGQQLRPIRKGALDLDLLDDLRHAW